MSSRRTHSCLLAACLAALASSPGKAQNVSERYLLAAANQERAAHGLAPLRIDDHLAQAARLHAGVMANRAQISHQFAGEPDLAARVGDAGMHFSLVTENVAEASNSALIHELWMNSAGHRANLLDPEVDAVGIAVVQRQGQLYAVEDFARTVVALSLEQQENAVAQALAPAGLRIATGTAEARQTCTLASGYAGARQPTFVIRYTSADMRAVPRELTTRIATGKYQTVVVGACTTARQAPFTSYSVAVMLFP